MDGVVGEEHKEEKEEKEDEAWSPGEDGPSPGVEAHCWPSPGALDEQAMEDEEGWKLDEL